MTIKDILYKVQKEKDVVIPELPFHAVIVPILMKDKNNEIQLVFQKRARHIAQGGEICFAGGKVEKFDKSLKSAAKREVIEEMGLKNSQIKIKKKLVRLNHFNFSVLDVFLGVTTVQSISDFPFDIREVESVFCVPLEYFLTTKPTADYLKGTIIAREMLVDGSLKTYFSVIDEIDSDKKGKDSWEIQGQLVLSYKTPYGVIWGITASIIYTLALSINGKAFTN